MGSWRAAAARQRSWLDDVRSMEGLGGRNLIIYCDLRIFKPDDH